jgi:hypothetical protein
MVAEKNRVCFFEGVNLRIFFTSFTNPYQAFCLLHPEPEFQFLKDSHVHHCTNLKSLPGVAISISTLFLKAAIWLPYQHHRKHKAVITADIYYKP